MEDVILALVEVSNESLIEAYNYHQQLKLEAKAQKKDAIAKYKDDYKFRWWQIFRKRMTSEKLFKEDMMRWWGGEYSLLYASDLISKEHYEAMRYHWQGAEQTILGIIELKNTNYALVNQYIVSYLNQFKESNNE